QLQQALQDAGLKSNNSGLQFSLRDQNSSGQNGGDNQQNGNAQRLIVTEDETVPAQLAGRSYGRVFSAQGGVDIRV
ncbi:MAG: flagellar hook-length control protein FliK, partial [Bradyrhizobium sp.]|nr:flagellar hook-length control protein FliK [Bradyrhizobium sp.]